MAVLQHDRCNMKRLLQERTFDPRGQAVISATLISGALHSNHKSELTEELLAHGADVNYQNLVGFHPPHILVALII